jgi:hypothetical protein
MTDFQAMNDGMSLRVSGNSQREGAAAAEGARVDAAEPLRLKRGDLNRVLLVRFQWSHATKRCGLGTIGGCCSERSNLASQRRAVAFD